LPKIQYNKRASSGHKQSSKADKTDGQTRQVGQQGRWANKAGGPTRQWANKAGGPTKQVGKQGRWSNMAGGPKKQMGQQGRQARPMVVPALAVNMFAQSYKQN
jgi:hypothetical protein